MLFSFLKRFANFIISFSSLEHLHVYDKKLYEMNADIDSYLN